MAQAAATTSSARNEDAAESASRTESRTIAVTSDVRTKMSSRNPTPPDEQQQPPAVRNTLQRRRQRAATDRSQEDRMRGAMTVSVFRPLRPPCSWCRSRDNRGWRTRLRAMADRGKRCRRITGLLDLNGQEPVAAIVGHEAPQVFFNFYHEQLPATSSSSTQPSDPPTCPRRVMAPS